MSLNETLIDLLLEYNAEYAKILWPGTLFYLLILVIGLFGNGYVLFIYKFKLKDESENRYFIPYLAIADACCSLVSCMSMIFDNFHFLYYPSDSVCKGFLYLLFITGAVSNFFLLAIAVQRYTKINPSGRQCTQRGMRATVGFILIFSAIISIPMPLIAGVHEGNREFRGVNLTSVKCGPQNGKYPTFEKFYFITGGVILFFNFVIMLGLYVPIAVTVYKRYRSRRRSSKIN